MQAMGMRSDGIMFTFSRLLTVTLEKLVRYDKFHADLHLLISRTQVHPGIFGLPTLGVTRVMPPATIVHSDRASMSSPSREGNVIICPRTATSCLTLGSRILTGTT